MKDFSNVLDSIERASDFQKAPKDLCDDKEFVLAAVSKNGYILEYVSDEFRNDKDVVMAAISENVYAVSSASDSLRDDKEVVMTAVSKNGLSLEHASERLKNDKEVVMTAISTAPISIQFASDELKHDKEVILTAAVLNENSLYFVPYEMKHDTEIIEELESYDINAEDYMIHEQFPVKYEVSYTDYTDYDPDRCNNGGSYSYTTILSKNADDRYYKWERSSGDGDMFERKDPVEISKEEFEKLEEYFEKSESYEFDYRYEASDQDDTDYDPVD